MASAVKHVAFFGATGGCALACLVRSLQEANIKSHALSRTASKLQGLLTERKVPEADASARLNIVEGDVKSVDSVKKVLFPTELNGDPVDVIVSGIGGAITMSNPLSPTLTDPTVCEDATKTMFEALASNKSSTGKKPRICVLSSTGISEAGRDIPLAMMPLYHWLLKVPHKDKAAMERLIRAETEKPVEDRILSSALVVRPSFLTNGPATSLDSIRVGTDEKPAIGYTISRDDVGLWLFHNAIQGNREGVFSVTS